MKILIVMNYRPNETGLTAAIEQLTGDLRNEGFIIDVVSTYGSIFNRIKGFTDAFKRARNYDLVFAVGCSYRGFIPILIGVGASKLYKKRIIVNFHDGMVDIFMNKWSKFIKPVINGIPIVVATEFLKSVFNKYGLGAIVIPNHFDFYRNLPCRQKPFKWNKKFVWARSFHPIYDPETALKACISICRLREDLEFHFFGDGRLRKKLEKKYQHPNIIFRGFVPRDKFLKEYDNFSVLINSSLYDNFPLSIVEAGHNELLIISTRIGGISTTYTDEECLFFNEGDYNKLRELILSVIENPSLYDPTRKKLQEKILSFTWDDVKKKWLNLVLQE